MFLFTYLSDDTKEQKTKFEKIYCAYRDMLYYCALGVVKSPADAEDVLQNAFIKIAENLNNIKEPDSKSTAAYLTVITKTTAYDFLRARKKFKEVSFEETEVCVEDDFIEQIALKTDYERLVDCIKSIPSPYNEVLFLHFVYELSAEKTAALLSRKKSTVKMQLVRGKKILLEKIGGEGRE